EPVLRACDGTWVAHGSGDADRLTVDAGNRIRVPPDHPAYTLRRVWIPPDEERGYYYGFANEGLWPLCHIAHTRPVFRASDFKSYATVNERFAEAVIEEMSGTDAPIVLVQDYHFALLPRMIKAARPDAQVAVTAVRPFPISVAVKETKPGEEKPRIPPADLVQGLGVPAHMLGIGVDRAD